MPYRLILVTLHKNDFSIDLIFQVSLTAVSTSRNPPWQLGRFGTLNVPRTLPEHFSLRLLMIRLPPIMSGSTMKILRWAHRFRLSILAHTKMHRSKESHWVTVRALRHVAFCCGACAVSGLDQENKLGERGRYVLFWSCWISIYAFNKPSSYIVFYCIALYGFVCSRVTTKSKVTNDAIANRNK